MTEFLPQIQLDQVRCEQHDEVANFICLDKECDKKGLSCPICESLYHKDHAFKPLKYFLSELTQSQSRSNSLALISARIDSTLSQIHGQFTKVASVDDKTQLNRAFAAYVNQLNKKINNEFEIDKELKDFFDSADRLTIKQINQFLNKFELHEYEPENPPPKPLTNQEKYLYQMLQMLKDKNEDLAALMKAKADVKDILGLFIFSEVKQKLNFVFSEEFHHTSIKINDKLTAKQEHNYSSNFALIEPMVMGKKKTMEKKSVKIKIDKLNSWINLGICIKSKAISSNYYLNTQDVGHGGYTLSNDGYSWHNVDSSLNSHYHGWNFAQGDIVIMTYDPKAKTIKYSKENTDKEFELSCEPIAGEEMYFCCTLNTHDEAVSIVQ